MKFIQAGIVFGLISLNFAGEAKKSSIEKAEIKTEKSLTSKDYKKKYPDISQKDLQEAIKNNKVVILDANGKKSFQTGHIPGAIHYHSEDISKKLPEDKEALIVAYCGGPGCEAWCEAADEAEKLGYKNIRHFSGGIKGWKKAGLDTQKPAKKEKSKKKEG